MMFVGVLGVAGPDVSFIGYQAASGNSFSIGAAAANRRLFALVHWGEDGNHRTLTSATIGGVSATVHLQEGHTGGSTGFGVAIISAIVPSGTTASIVTSYTGTPNGKVTHEGFSLYRATGLVDSSPSDTGSDTTSVLSQSLSVTVTVPALGIVIGGYSASQLSDSLVAWSGATENYDTGDPPGFGYVRSGAFQAYAGGSASQVVSVTKPNENNSGNALVAVTWK